MTASAIGDNKNVGRLIVAAEKKKPAELNRSEITTIGFGSNKCRVAVRGLRCKSDKYTKRLKSIAAVPAHTMQTRRSSKIRGEGQPFAETISAPSAKGSAK